MNMLIISVWLISVLAVICIFGIFRIQILSLNESFFAMIDGPIATAISGLQQRWLTISRNFKKQFSDKDGKINLKQLINEIIGSFYYSICFGLFSFAEFHLILLTLAAMGIETDFLEPPGGAGTSTAISLIVSVIFFGTVLFDLVGKTQIAPWLQRLDSKWREVLFIICILCLVLSSVTGMLFGYWRAKASADDTAYLSYTDEIFLSGGGLTSLNGNITQTYDNLYEDTSNTSDAWVPLTVNLVIPVLLILGGLLSGSGFIEFFRFLMIGLAFLFILPIFIFLVFSFYSSRVLNLIYNLFVRLIELISVMGLWFLALFNYHPKVPTPPSSHQQPPPPVSEEPDDFEEDYPFINPYENKKDD